MSLHDILMSRAAIHFKNEQGGDFTGLGLNNLWSSVGESIARKQTEMREQRNQDISNTKRQEQFTRILNAAKRGGQKIRTSINKDGEASYSISPVDDEEDAYKQESLRIRRDNLEQKIVEEKRRTLTQKLNTARNIGGIISADEMQTLNQDVGFDIGTDLNTGRIEQTPDDKFRILSNEEFSKKSDIIKSVKDSESGVNIVLNDLEQVSRLFDEVTPNLKGPIEGRLKAPVQGFLGNTGVRVYDDMKKAFIGNISRSILLERGVLTDKDVERAAGLLPKLEDTEEIKNKKIDEIKTLLSTRYSEFKRRKDSGLSNIGDSINSDSNFENLWK